MPTPLETEAHETYARFVAARDEVDAGRKPWSALADFFTEDAAYIDPAWGRIEGRENIRDFFERSMAGLTGYGWSTPENWTMCEGPRLVSQWDQILGQKPDGTPWLVAGLSILYYAGGGKLLLQPRHAEHDARRRDAEGDGMEAAGRLQHAPAQAEPRHLAAEGVGAPREESGALAAASFPAAASADSPCDS